MKQSIRALALLALVLCGGLLGSSATQAELSEAMVAELTSPILRLAFGLSPEAKVLATRMAGQSMMLTPGKPDAWRTQVEQMVHGLMTSSPEVADDVYLRLLRIKYRFLQDMPPGSKVLSGSN